MSTAALPPPRVAARASTSMAASPPSPSRRSRARRGSGGDLRAEILAVTTRLLAETGDEASVSIRMIADAIGVTPPSIYLHFADKATLILAVCEQQLAELDRELTEAAGAAEDPLDEILRRCRAYADFGLAHPEQYRVVFMSRPAPDGKPSPGAAVLDHLVDSVQRAVDRGAIPTCEAGAAALQLWFAMHGLTSLLLSRPSRDLPPVPELIDATLRRLRVQLLTAGDDVEPAPPPSA